VVDTRSVVWVDAGAGVTITRINSTAGSAGIEADLLAISNADVQQNWFGTLAVNGAPTPAAAQYQSVTERVSFTFTTTAPGILITLTLPSPQAGIFLADQRTVDLANAGVVTLAAACVGNLCDVSGNTATALIAGTIG